jgi:hypothetical protein
LVLITLYNTFVNMGRKASQQSNTMYALAQGAVDGMTIGDVRTIAMPDDLAFFRKYLSEISKRFECRYTTKSLPSGKLQIMRVKYYNIHSQKVEK